MSSPTQQPSFPPPPPSPQTSSGLVPGRRRFPLQPPSLSTVVTARQRLSSETPTSAISGISPFSTGVRSPTFASPSSPMPSRTSTGVVLPYNPQEWSQGNTAAGAGARSSGLRRTTDSREASGMEPSLPSPPPPYSASPESAPQSARVFYPSPSLGGISHTVSPINTQSEYNTPTSAGTSVSPGGIPSFQRPQPSASIGVSASAQSPPSSYHFASTTSERDRSTSRSRFTSTFTGRHRATDSSVSNTTLPDVTPNTTDYNSSHALPTAAIFLPPGARRAASAGCITPQSSTPHSSTPVQRSPEPDSSLYDPNRSHGIALPPPPPGPPPNARSQSLNRVTDLATNPSNFGAIGSNLRAAQHRDSLGPVPPTPADWTDDDQQKFRLGQNYSRTNQFSKKNEENETSESIRRNTNTESHFMRDESRSRNRFAKESSSMRELRERRSQSRGSRVRDTSRDGTHAAESSGKPSSMESGSVQPANLVLSSSTTGGIGRRRHVSKSKTSPLLDGSSPRHSRVLDPERRLSDHAYIQSPLPISPHSTSDPHNEASSAADASVPLSNLQSSPSSTTRSPRTSPRIIPRVLHIPHQSSNSLQSIASPRPSSSKSQGHEINIFESNAFAKASLDRYKVFVMQEARAFNDAERLKLFADFMVKESRLRRDRYSNAFDNLGSKIFDLTRDLWRPGYEEYMATSKPEIAVDTARDRLRQRPETPNEPSSAESHQSAAAFTPNSSADSPGGASKAINDNRQNSYQPMLSPIPSMAMSVEPGGGESRGRAPSRWWEGSTGAGSVGDARKIERTKRETKYMGLAREARENMQWAVPQDSPGLGTSTPAANQQSFQLGPNEYPPEKVGWHEEERPSPRFPHHSRTASKAKSMPMLDVSRLVTLPPPYPRHHPAINNNHPDLNDLRVTLRFISDKSEIAKLREDFEARRPPPESPSAVIERRTQLRRRIQDDVNSGKISFAEAARFEADFDAQETKKSREKAQKEFDQFQTDVMSPLNTRYRDGMSKASDSIDRLCESLNDDARSHDPNQTQEEGDEKPELLEKLTLMKWFFESREQLYKESFELESESDDRYKVVILMPYRVAGNHEKIREVESFFIKDSHERRLKYENKAATRFEMFLKTVEKNVTRGAENQLSAFWDIAPPLLEVVQRIPSDLTSFDVLIPEEEYDESPSYQDYPLQYLYSLLQHAEKSAYQFIESQTNLLCLLHEVKSGVMTAGCRILETQRIIAGEDKPSVKREMQAIRVDEDNRLTAELKERVEVVEEQWKQALGRDVQDCEKRIKDFLITRDGWDESLDE